MLKFFQHLRLGHQFWDARYMRFSFYRKVFIIILAISFFILPARAVYATPSLPISGTFIMSDVSFTSESQLQGMFDEMQATGINIVIFLASGGIETPCTPNVPSFTEKYYFTESYKWYLSSLRLAKAKNMQIFFGLVNTDMFFCTPFWIGTPTDTNTYMGRILDYSSRLVDQVKQTVEQQGWSWDDPVFAGFYVFENSIAHFTNPNGADIKFYRELTARIKQRAPNKKILVSPWKTENITYNQAKIQFTNLLQYTDIDIVAPQDGMGAGLVTSYARNAKHFKALHDAVARFPGKEAWANIETFQQDSNNSGTFIPSTIDKVQNQIESARPYITKMITWIYQHSMLSDPAFDNIYSWTGQYTPANAVRRKQLRQDYLNTYLPTSTPTAIPTSTPTPTSTATPTYNPGDLNHDGKVDIFDYNILVSDFGKTGTPGWIPADIIKNGKVDIFDYNILVGNFGLPAG